jgi:hypothetical protein
MIRILGSRCCSGIDGWPRQRCAPLGCGRGDSGPCCISTVCGGYASVPLSGFWRWGREMPALDRYYCWLLLTGCSTALRMLRDMMPALALAVRAAAGHPVGVRKSNAASLVDRASCAVRDPHGLAGGLQLARPAAPSARSLAPVRACARLSAHCTR